MVMMMLWIQEPVYFIGTSVFVFGFVGIFLTIGILGIPFWLVMGNKKLKEKQQDVKNMKEYAERKKADSRSFSEIVRENNEKRMREWEEKMKKERN